MCPHQPTPDSSLDHCGLARHPRLSRVSLAAILSLSSTLSAVAQLAQDMDGSVIADTGDYYYQGGRYDSFDPGAVVAGAIDSAFVVADTVRYATTFLNNVTDFGGWTNFADGDGFLGARGGVSLAGRTVPSRLGPAFTPAGQASLQLGPLVLDQIAVGAGFMYSEFSGRPLQRLPQQPRDEQDSVAAILYTSFRLSAYISDRFAITVRPMLYYLPLVNRAGYMARTRTFFGLADTTLVPDTLLEMVYRTYIGEWELLLYDRFSVRLNSASLLDSELFYDFTLWDNSAFDLAGRYSFGNLFAPPVNEATGREQFQLGDQFFDENAFLFRNVATSVLSYRPSPNTRASIYYRRTDVWDNNFDHLAAWNTAGVFLTRTSARWREYFKYTVSSDDSFQNPLHWVNVGVLGQLGPTLVADMSVGYLFMGNRTRESALGRFALEHRLGPRTTHGVMIGRQVTDPEFGGRYLADFVRYYLGHRFFPAGDLRLFAQYSQAERLGVTRGTDFNSFVAGALFHMRLSSLDSLTFLNTYQTYNRESAPGYTWHYWKHRLEYSRVLGARCTGHFYYQYQHGDSDAILGNDFAEHLLYLGVVKYF